MTAVRDRIFGTEVLLAGLPPDAQAAALDALRRAERVFSRFVPDSDTSRVNAAAGGPVPVSPQFAAALAEGCAHARATGGVFSPLLGADVAATGYDVTFTEVPGRPGRPVPPPVTAPVVRIDHDTGTVAVPRGVAVDLGGFVKGWAVQRVADELRAAGAPRGLIDAGGDVAAWHPPGAPPWRVGVEHPLTGSTVTELALGPRTAVATSSTARRRWRGSDGRSRHHVVDPRTGHPAASGCTQATVVAADLGAAEAAATCVLVLGVEDGPHWLAAHDPAARWITVDDAGTVRCGP